MSRETQIFIQHELIEKDFMNLQGFMTIPFKSIYAEISGGGYTISLDDVDADFQGRTE